MNKQCNEKVVEHELRMVELLLHHVCKQDGVYKTIKTKSGSIGYLLFFNTASACGFALKECGSATMNYPIGKAFILFGGWGMGGRHCSQKPRSTLPKV
jgi:hypothetical protein